MLSCIQHHFEQLEDLGKQRAKEDLVQAEWLKLFQALHAIAALGDCIPCFQVHDTSVRNYLTSPTAKADFTSTINGQVGSLQFLYGWPLGRVACHAMHGCRGDTPADIDGYP